MADWNNLPQIRRDYGVLILEENQAAANPFDQFKSWFSEVSECEKNDPSAMVVSTVDDAGLPDSRVVLLKSLQDDSFVFYTNYDSHKATQLEHLAFAALNFYWPEMARQVRVRGKVEKTSAAISDHYFASRPLSSQLSAIASPQSQVITNRQFLEDQYQHLLETCQQTSISRPENWGGYRLIPDEIEFWQGRDNRLHDRLVYLKKDNTWIIKRLAP